MTHIEQMIQDMCPNGVEFKTLGEVCDVYTGGEPPIDCIKTKAPEGDYIYPIYSNGVGDNAIYGFAKTYTINERAVTFSSIGTIGHPTLREGKFTPIIRLKVIIPKDDSSLNISFVKYALDVAKFSNNKSSLPNINAQMLKQIEIPLPPLEIQKKIVECLDKFSALAAELQAELQMRRKQYEYYRTQLLTPHSDCNSATKSDDAQWEWKTLGEITLPAVNIKWKHVDATTEYQYVDLTSVNRENRNIEGTNIINKETAPSRAQQIIETGDILFGTTRPTLQRYCYVPKEYNGQICSTGYCVLRANKNVVLPKWIYYQLSLNSFIDYVTANQSGAAYPSISDSQVKAYKIPLPPLAEQERIVSILDKFEALTTSLSDGIPAEQAAQQKRYEYYRDLLLTFDRKAV